MNRKWLMAMAAVALLGACDGNPPGNLGTASPATGAALAHYSENSTDAVKLGANADLVQRFCKNMTGAACPADIGEKLSAAGFKGEGSGVDLAAAFAKMEADKIDGQADLQSTAETYFQALYRVILAREPDQDGAAANLKFLKETGERNQLARAMMQSPEFKTLP
ncbi:MAG: DUF4214 domain-containing protein [Hyphomonadaceae bacterium]